MKHVCVIVSDNVELVDKIQTGLPYATNEILHVFATAQACRKFLDEDGWRLKKLRIIVDTLIDVDRDEERAYVELDQCSPSTQLMEYIHFTCADWRILALTSPQCTNDAVLALQHEPYWYCHSTDVLGWESPALIENAFENVEQLRKIAQKQAEQADAAA